jgi:hypothetical protein
MIPSSIPCNAQLARHPETRCEFVSGIEVRVSRKERNHFTVVYVLTGDLLDIRIPSPAAPRRADRLWEHTCFEAFVRVKGRPAYYEFNFSPSGEWAVYAFRGYRDGGPGNDDTLEPNITVRRKGKTLELNAVIRLDFLPTKEVGAGLRLGLCAVIEEIDGRLSYWALEHPSGKPDFHHPDSFALEIPLPG